MGTEGRAYVTEIMVRHLRISKEGLLLPKILTPYKVKRDAEGI